MGVIVSDNFNRGDSTGLGANWTALPSLSALNVSSNVAKGPSGIGGCSYSGTTLSADQFCEARGIGLNNSLSRHAWVGVRTGGGTGNEGYYIQFDDTSAILNYTDSGGTDHLLQTLGASFTSVDMCRIQIVGTTIKCFKNGVQIGTDQTDANIASGAPGIIASDNQTGVDDFEAGDLPGILFDAESHNAKGTSDTNALTLTHPTGSGLTAAHVDVFVRMIGASPQTVSTMTYDGTGMTFVSRNTSVLDDFNTFEHWRMELGDNPSSGNKSIVITPSASCRMIGWAVTRQNVDQTTPLHGSDTYNEGTGVTATNSATAAAGELVVDGVSPSGGKTLTCNNSIQITNYSPGDVIVGSENTGVGTVTSTWTLNLSDVWFSLMWVLALASSAPATKPSGPFPTFRPDLP